MKARLVLLTIGDFFARPAGHQRRHAPDTPAFPLATTGRSGYDTSVAIGVDGIPVISHQNIDEGDLELSFGPTTTYTVTFE